MAHNHDHCAECAVHEHHHHGGEENPKKTLLKLVIGGVLFLAGWFLAEREMISAWFLLVPYLILAFDTLKEAGENILHGEIFDESFLMSIASLGAIGIGELEEACAVMLFYGIGEFLEDRVTDKSRDSIEALMDIRPDTATVLRNGEETTVSPEEVLLGEVIVIRPGERIPLDGIIAEGHTTVDTSSLTGESLPVEKEPADRVQSGTINLSGLIKVRVESVFAESTVTKVMELVEHSAEKKAAAETFIEKFAHVYTPIVCAGAVLLAVMGPLATHGSWQTWIYRACSFLVVSCPCAMVISVPLAFFGGVGAASHAGILVKGTNYLESLTKLDTVVFDKTGTLTKGTFAVLDVRPTEHCCFETIPGVVHHDHKDCLLHLAAAVETFSDHPIAKSVVFAAESHTHHAEHAHTHAHADECGCGAAGGFECSNALFPEHCILNVKEVAGKGVVCVADGMECLVGNGKLMADFGVDKEPSFIAYREQAKAETGTLIHVALNHIYMGYLRIGDAVKADTKEALHELRRDGIKRLVMLTGDAKNTADLVARELDADLEVHANLLPGEKVSEVEKILAEGAKLAFVGDGINDAPVLTRADVGIAMGALGSDAAIASADVVIMDDKLSNLPRAFEIARKTVRIARTNVIFALAVKALILILSAAGITSLWLAVFGDVGVLILTVLNATRTMRA